MRDIRLAATATFHHFKYRKRFPIDDENLAWTPIRGEFPRNTAISGDFRAVSYGVEIQSGRTRSHPIRCRKREESYAASGGAYTALSAAS